MTQTDFKKAAIIGHPVAHSKSPIIHNYWLKKYGIAGEYEAIDAPDGQLGDVLHRLVRENYAGFNVTLPHKQIVMHMCDGVDALALSIGAVNLVSIENGQMMGSNSDAFGFCGSIKQEKPDFDFKEGPALVLGAGGATRAILHGMLDEGVPEIRLANRSKNRAEELAANSGEPHRIKIIDWGDRADVMTDVYFLVNTTSLGMDGQPPLEINLDALNKNALVADIVYKPLKTKLIEDAERRGNPVIGGIGMLLHQARPAFQQWFGVMPDIDDELIKLVTR